MEVGAIVSIVAMAVSLHFVMEVADAGGGAVGGF